MNAKAYNDITFLDYIQSGASNFGVSALELVRSGVLLDDIKTAKIYDVWEHDILVLINDEGYFPYLEGFVSPEDFPLSSMHRIKETRLFTALLILMTAEQRKEQLT